MILFSFKDVRKNFIDILSEFERGHLSLGGESHGSPLVTATTPGNIDAVRRMIREDS